MRNFRIRRSIACVASAAACVSGCVSSIALADLAVDLRATAHNGNALVVGETPHFIPGVVNGDVISFDIFVTATGTNANVFDDKIVAIDGSVLSQHTFPLGNLRGTLQLDYVRTTYDGNGDPISFGFDGPTASVGLQQDLDGDGDLDVGSNNDPSPQLFWAARFIGGAAGATAPPPVGRKVGFGTFTVTDGANDGVTFLFFRGRNSGTAAQFWQDGVLGSGPSHTSPNGILIQGIPEPTALGVASLMGLVALRRRR